MSDHIYRVIEVVGSSRESSDEAIARASTTVDDIGWFEVVGTREHIEAGRIAHFQVTIKIGFTVADAHGDGS